MTVDPRQRALSARRRYVVTQLKEVKERPKTPKQIRQDAAVARYRADDLQEIFRSRHADTGEVLRKKLAALDEEVAGLRSAIASTEKALQGAIADRTVRDELLDSKALPPAAGNDGTDPVASSEKTPSESDNEQEFGSKEDKDSGVAEEDEEEEQRGDASPASVAAEKRRTTAPDIAAARERLEQEKQEEKNKDDEAQSETLRRDTHFHSQRRDGQQIASDPQEDALTMRRRAEARIADAADNHARMVGLLQSEHERVLLRHRRQKVWIEQLKQQVLATEMAKVEYAARRDKAALRTRSLSQALSNAYKDTAQLLTERMAIDTGAAQGDAMLVYLDEISKKSMRYEDSVVNNNEVRLGLLDAYTSQHESRKRYEDVMEVAHHKQHQAVALAEQCQVLQQVHLHLRNLWLAIPGQLKDVAMQGPSGLQRQESLGDFGTIYNPAAPTMQIELHNCDLKGLQQRAQETLSQLLARHGDLMGEVDGCYIHGGEDPLLLQIPRVVPPGAAASS
eukprot:TRINITY_DN50133_c0_g1_i1.p1 TRINITY_DN50133_c0_g1~~TRINITY_DN50133_c0_g1_i1.p1  ORF type:complete len:508 (+),score=140.92 TRINITY_DN50133_c0_g1_i1:94-1617(+)